MQSIDLERFIEILLSERRYTENLLAQRITEPREAIFGDLPAALDPRISDLLPALGIKDLFQHQTQAIEPALQGENIAISTGVSSGKSLCYQLPIIDAIIRNPRSRALLIYPTKALAQDQQHKFGGMLTHLACMDKKHARTFCGIYDGDTPAASRQSIRKLANAVFTNPDMLHLGVLPHHTLWTDFLANLRYVVIDEIHSYRGVFGSHFANVLRRLKRICRLYGSEPQFFCTSATIQNTAQFCQALIGSPVRLIHQDCSPQGRRIFHIVNPPMVDFDLGIRRSSIHETGYLARRFLHFGGQALLFSETRRAVEVIYRYLIDDGRDPSLIRSYRSGYLPENRRAVEKGLRDGSIALVVTTNALELGIDIGGLDATFINGYPGTIAGTRQQAGRAGRKGASALCILVASANPLDQYIARHPEYLFDNNPESAFIDPDNTEILIKHLHCAVQELAVTDGEGFGDLAPFQIQPYLDLLLQRGDIRHIGNRYTGVLNAYPAGTFSIRNASNQYIITLYKAPEDSGSSLNRALKESAPTNQTGGMPNSDAAQRALWQDAPTAEDQMIGLVDEESVNWMTHPDAIYLHEGETWIVKTLDRERKTVAIEPIRVNYYTQTTQNTVLELTQLLQNQAITGAQKYLGKVIVTKTITGYKKLRFSTQEVLGYEELDMPPAHLDTVAFWIALDPKTIDAIKDQGLWRNQSNDYGRGWKELTHRIRERDGHACRSCGTKESGKAFDVHHIIPFRHFATLDQANEPSNLVTLCPRCHRLAESSVLIQSGLGALGYLLGNIAPFFVMCDRKDIGIHTEEASAIAHDLPIVCIYDQVAGGIGLSTKLYAMHQRIIRAAYDQIKSCQCTGGCPACTGPVAEHGSGAKEHAAAILSSLLDYLSITLV